MNTGTVLSVAGSLVSADFREPIALGEVAFVLLPGTAQRLKAEVIRIRQGRADLQVFEDTRDLKVGHGVEYSGELLSVELGPGLLGQVFDGLQNPLPALAQAHGFFLQRGVNLPALPRDKTFTFTPTAQAGQGVRAGDELGHVAEGTVRHRIMVPLRLPGGWTVTRLAPAGDYGVDTPVATLAGDDGRETTVSMLQTWPVKLAIQAYDERLMPTEPLTTKIRVVDTFCPVAKGGTYCIPGPFGAGKTVIQHLTSRHADVDVVIVAACGERAGEVVELIREYPELTDPRTGRSLMERTVIICNTSSMPVAARESSVYTGLTLAEYYRQMGLHVLLLVDSTSRWAQAQREISARLEEIPGEEAYPAYLESVIAAFYERAGLVRLRDGALGSVTVGGTVSPAGGNFEEPVTQATLKVVGAFHGLSRERSDARRYPAIDVLSSWSVYPGAVSAPLAAKARQVLRQGAEVEQMMRVVGEEGVGPDDYLTYLKAEFLDAAYLQQDAFHPVDGATDAARQAHVFGFMAEILDAPLAFQGRDAARGFFQKLVQAVKDWNLIPMDDPAFAGAESGVRALLGQAGQLHQPAPASEAGHA